MKRDRFDNPLLDDEDTELYNELFLLNFGSEEGVSPAPEQVDRRDIDRHGNLKPRIRFRSDGLRSAMKYKILIPVEQKYFEELCYLLESTKKLTAQGRNSIADNFCQRHYAETGYYPRQEFLHGLADFILMSDLTSRATSKMTTEDTPILSRKQQSRRWERERQGYSETQLDYIKHDRDTNYHTGKIRTEDSPDTGRDRR